MKCCSRSTLGVVIGGINVLFYAGCAIVVLGLISSSNSAIKSNKDAIFHQPIDPFEVRETITVREDNSGLGAYILSTILSVCLVMCIISGLLIVGIVKRRHKLMWPWLALSGIAFVCSCARILFSVIVGLASGMAIPDVLIVLIAGVLGVGIQALILWPIYTLCRDIMQRNNQKPGQILDGVQYNYVAPDAPPQYNYYNSGLPQKS